MSVTQDIVKGADLSGLTIVTASQINQAIDIARTASDKGMAIVTTDTALDTPDVPDPDTAISGVTPLWWKRYIWIRKLYSSGAYAYLWDENATPGSLLQWVRVDAEGIANSEDIATALQNASDALTSANTAESKADQNSAAIITLQNDASSLSTVVTSNTNRITTLETAPASYRAGDIRCSAGSFTYSTNTNEGWLACNGASVAKSVFPGLFSVISYTYGGSGDNFTLPDLRGRTVVGVGQGTYSGASNRIIAETVGAETITLSEANVGKFTTSIEEEHGLGSGSKEAVFSITFNGQKLTASHPAGSVTAVLGPIDVFPTAQTAHSNMQPSIALNYYIKT